ncbi:hypothetical protein HPP92_020146 [Vanilla planifolia]|uniref:Uncharacterized protein n=1 Tax=Vanilla planifolia TaxID=51239 RepID=A0A835UJK9_VANPL|nr:hypothetical protein HPP92_020146 [Vanilla planifolia]
MLSPKEPSPDSRSARRMPIRQTPLQIIHIVGNFMRIWSVYSLYHHLSQRGDSVILFMFCCLVPASLIFLFLQKPWKGRPLPNSQVAPTIINGAIMALFLILWGRGLLSCGPLVTLLAEYAGAVLGVLSALFYGRRVSLWKKLGGLFAMAASFYFLSMGWATRTYSPFYSFGSEPVAQTKQPLQIKEITVPILAGILSAVRRVMARRVSLKNQLKRRLHAITVASAACFLFPLAMWDSILGSDSNSIANLHFTSWAYLSTVLFGIVFIYYIDNLAEERLHLVFSSPRHLVVATGCIIVMEILYKMDFSPLGFLICSLVLALGIFEATSLERSKRGYLDSQEITEATLKMSSLPS